MFKFSQKVETSKGHKAVDIDVKIQESAITPIDPKKTALELEVEKRALLDAKDNVPLKEAIFPSSLESEIQNYVAKRVNDYVIWGNQRVQYCDEVMQKSQIDVQVVTDFRNTVNKFKSDSLQTWKVDYVSDLRKQKEQYEVAKDSLEEFQKENNLPVRPFKPKSPVLSYAILLLLILAETLINAGLFAKGLEHGVLSGAMMAFGAALANVMMSFYLFAQLFRGLQIRCPTSTKCFKLGLLITLLWLTLELVFSFGFAHYRDALEAFADAGFEGFNPASVAVQEFFTPLKDMLSWALWLLTIAFGAIAYVDGIHMKEPFPGYQQKYDEVQDLEEQYLSLLDKANSDLNGMKDQTVNNIQECIDKMQGNFRAFRNAVSDKKSAETQFKNVWHTSITAYTTLIKQYQDTNIKNRTDKERDSIPSYFMDPVNIDVSGIWKQTTPSFNAEADQKALHDQEKLRDSVQCQLQQLIDTVHQESANAIGPFLSYKV